MKDWTQEALCYHIYPLGFCGAPQYHQEHITNRLHKIEAWIPHMLSLSINTLYLGPIFESYEHGYDTSDYQLIDHRLGTNADFKQLCMKLHRAGIRIILDGVFNHVGRHFWAFKDVQQHGCSSQYCSWFHNLNFQNRSPMNDAFTYDAWEGHYNLVKLNLQNAEVVQYLLSSVEMWMEEFHIDGIRLDAADCVDQSFFKQLKTFTKERDDNFWLMGEIIHGDYNRWANPQMLDSITNYECYKGLYSSHNEKNYFEIAHSLQRQFAKGGIYQNLTLYNFVDNHDVNRIASTLHNLDDLTNIYTLLYTMPGIPSIYYGSEWALTGKKHDGSDQDIRPSLSLHDHHDHQQLALCDYLKKLGTIKTALTPLAGGSYEQLLVRNEQFIFMRKKDQEEVIVACNVSEQAYNLELPCHHEVLYDVLHEQSHACINGNLCIVLEPKQSYIFTNKMTIDSPADDLPNEIISMIIPEHTPIIKHEHEISIQQEQPASTIIPGKYQHFKGKNYAVLYTAKHSETLEEYVVYRQLYDKGEVWVRPLSMFLETVEMKGERLPRFRYIGE